MVKKIDKVYLNENTELNTQNILIEGKEKKTEQAKKVGGNIWSVLRPVAAIAISILVVYFGVRFVYDKVKNDYFEPVDIHSELVKTVDIPKGSSLSGISEILEENEIIKNKNVFKLYVDFSDMSSKLKAGTYELSPNMNFDEIIYELRQGVLEAATSMVTLKEGKTISDFADMLIEGGIKINKDAFIKECMYGNKFADNQYINQVLVNIEETGKLRNLNLEGYLFPDTYDFYRDSSEEDIITKLLARFNDMISEEDIARAAEINMSIDDIIILASIIEKEGIKEDFEKISAVFHNRLKKDMPFQTDASLQYVLNKGTVKLTSEELALDSLYNTHLNKGLPPGPISNPGRAAINAALYPDEEYIAENYIFFCLTTPDTGKSVFAKTNEEHEANIAQYSQYWE